MLHDAGEIPLDDVLVELQGFLGRLRQLRQVVRGERLRVLVGVRKVVQGDVGLLRDLAELVRERAQ